ncbi:MAG TPA: glutamine-hydrolyzing GMP synthase, partial [Dongiaceae bacterium]
MTDRILILDFGSQVTQLIARRVREAGVYCEIFPFNTDPKRIADFEPKGIILSGSPHSVHAEGGPQAPDVVWQSKLPVFGICYGQQAMCHQLGGKVEPHEHREFGRAELEITAQCDLFDGFWTKGTKDQVWMSHGDRVTAIPPGFRVVGVSKGAPFAAIADETRHYYGFQFHPEVVHTPRGARLLRQFVHQVCGCKGDWTMRAFRESEVAKIRAQVGKGKVICGLSGGVESAVAAVLIHEAIGEQLTCIFVDHGLLRQGEAEQVLRLFHDHYNIPLIHRDASDLFLGEL